jgi:hypothetical protein
VLRTPELVEVKAATLSNQRTNEFSLNATMRQTVVIDPSAPIDAQPKPGAPTKSDAARQAVMNKISN